MESAALILAQDLHQPDRAADAYRRASELFVTQGKGYIRCIHCHNLSLLFTLLKLGSVDRGAEQLEKAAK
jgi:hypothetical protein